MGNPRYRTVVEEVPQGDYMIPLSVARVAREGTDITLVGWGQQVTVLERAVNPLPVNSIPTCDSTPIIAMGRLAKAWDSSARVQIPL